jgi:hypothetical protein
MSAAIGKTTGNKSVASPRRFPTLESRKNSESMPEKSLASVFAEGFERASARGVVGYRAACRRHVSMAETGEKRDKFFAAMSEVMLAASYIPNTPLSGQCR